MNLHSHNNPFLTEKMVKNGYYGNEGFGLAWDGIEVRQIGLFITTNKNKECKRKTKMKTKTKTKMK